MSLPLAGDLELDALEGHFQTKLFYDSMKTNRAFEFTFQLVFLQLKLFLSQVLSCRSLNRVKFFNRNLCVAF